MAKANVKPIRKVDGKVIKLDGAGRLNLASVIDIWRPNRNSLMFATWKLMDRLNLSKEEAKKIGLEIRPDGNKIWTGKLPAADFELSPPEVQIVKLALRAGIDGGLLSVNSRSWLEPLMAEFGLNEEEKE